MIPRADMTAAPACILIVDDERDNRELLDVILTSEGYRILTAASGAEALATSAQERPDLMVLDVMMPGMTGYEVATRIKGDPATSGISILMFSALSAPDARMLGLSAGADDYLAKPVVYADLVSRVKNLLQLRIDATAETASRVDSSARPSSSRRAAGRRVTPRVKSGAPKSGAK
jgi:diguanylate cyclase